LAQRLKYQYLYVPDEPRLTIHMCNGDFGELWWGALELLLELGHRWEPFLELPASSKPYYQGIVSRTVVMEQTSP
jgi:hypothetical protein